MRSNSGGAGGGRGGGRGGRERAFWDPTSSGHIYNRKDKGVKGVVLVVVVVVGGEWMGWFGVGFICIDPQDSDHEQLEIEGTEHKVWAYYIRCCLQGNVVLVNRVRQGNKTKRTKQHVTREYQAKRGSESKLEGGWWDGGGLRSITAVLRIQRQTWT